MTQQLAKHFFSILNSDESLTNECSCRSWSTNLIFVSFHSVSADKNSRRGAEPLYQNSRVAVGSSSSSDETDSFRKPPPHHVEREQRMDRQPRPAAQEMMESQYETGYTTGDTGNELDRDHTDYLYRSATTLLPCHDCKHAVVRKYLGKESVFCV